MEREREREREDIEHSSNSSNDKQSVFKFIKSPSSTASRTRPHARHLLPAPHSPAVHPLPAYRLCHQLARTPPAACPSHPPAAST